jgi:hypothetical protein
MSTPPTNESNTRARYITHALEQAGWDPLLQIHHEFPLRAGRVTKPSRIVIRVKEFRSPSADLRQKLYEQQTNQTLLADALLIQE